MHEHDPDLDTSPGFDPAFYRVRISRNSSLRKIQKRLVADRSIEVLLTENYDIWLHHSCWHVDLEKDSGVAACDIVASGSLNLGGVGSFSDDARIAIIRFKTSYRATAELMKGAEQAICEFLRQTRKDVAKG